MITVQADANKVLIPKERADAMMVLDSNDNGFAYMIDALAAISVIVVHAEKKYGPVITDGMLSALEGKTLRNKINAERGEKANEDQAEDSQSC